MFMHLSEKFSVFGKFYFSVRVNDSVRMYVADIFLFFIKQS